MHYYTTRDEAIEREIVAAIEAGGVAKASDYDVDAIADEVLGSRVSGGHAIYYVVADEDAFWQSVERHEISHD